MAFWLNFTETLFLNLIVLSSRVKPCFQERKLVLVVWCIQRLQASSLQQPGNFRYGFPFIVHGVGYDHG